MPNEKCAYCQGIWFIRNLRGGLECAGCGSPAPEGAAILDLVPNPLPPIAILKVKHSLSDMAVDRILASWAKVFPGQRVVILQEGMDVEFIGGRNASK